MKRPLFEARFYATYYYANVVRNVLFDQFDYLVTLDAFYGDDNYLGLIRPFEKESSFHRFIEFVVDHLLFEEAGEVDLEKRQKMMRRFGSSFSGFDDMSHLLKLPIEVEMLQYGIEHQSFVEWLMAAGKTFLDATEDDVSDYYYEFSDEQSFAYGELLERAVNEAFFILFQNRKILLFFNEMMAAQVRQVEADDLKSMNEECRTLFSAPGVLKRVHMPKWVKRAVFFRDRGLCVFCHCDLSGTLNIWSNEHYDHIVPLAGGGLNDVSNIQLLCGACNTRKKDGKASTSSRYEAWYAKG